MPAPFGPIRLTIEPSGIVEVDAGDGDEPAELLAHAGSFEQVRHRLRPSPRRTRYSSWTPSWYSRFWRALGQQALRAQQHDEHDDHAVDPARVLGHVDVGAEVQVHPRPGVRQALLVQVGEERGPEHHPPHVAHAAQDDHAEDEHRDVEVEVLREGRALEGGEVGARRSRRRTRRTRRPTSSSASAGCPSPRRRPRPRGSRSRHARAASRAAVRSRRR